MASAAGGGFGGWARNLLGSSVMDPLQEHIAALRPRADALCSALRREAERLFGAGALDACAAGTARYRLEQDPASGLDSLVGEWQGADGYRIGMLVFHGDGSCFAEFDVVRMHPRKSRWFVEAVEAWAGPPDADGAAPVRADLRLLAAP
jgi:hypothetical protein